LNQHPRLTSVDLISGQASSIELTMPPDHSITDTPPRLSDFPMSLPTPQHDPSPRTSEPSPLLPSPSTPPADSPPRFTSDLKGKRKVQVHQNSPHPGHRRQQSISAPVLILGAPLEKSTYNRENTPPPMDLDRTDTPPPSPRSQHSRPPITYGKRTPISSALLGEITSASSEPKDRSPPSPTPSKPIRALAPSTPELKAGPPLRLFFSVPFKVATPPPDLGGDKLDYFAKHIRGLQISPADDVGRGETVLRTLPLHGVLHTPLLETHCSGCFLDAEHKAKQGRTSLAAARKCFLECMRCQVAVFCSTVSRQSRIRAS